MTRPSGRQPSRDLTPIVTGTMNEWVPPFVMCVIGDERIFNALGPAVGPNGHIAPGAHFYRTVKPFEKGYTDPGDGSYAAALRRAHEEANIPTELLALAVRCNITIMCGVAAHRRRYELIAPLRAGAHRITQDFGIDEEHAVLATPSRTAVDDHYTPIRILPVMKPAFWEVLEYAQIRKALGNPSDDDVMATCLRYMPQPFVEQFRR